MRLGGDALLAKARNYAKENHGSVHWAKRDGKVLAGPLEAATEGAMISSLAQDTIFMAETIASILLGVFRQVVAVQLHFGTAG